MVNHNNRRANGKLYTFIYSPDNRKVEYILITEDEGFKGYWYNDSEGRRAHTWDFEESIGE
jgi:hypothetical protein